MALLMILDLSSLGGSRSEITTEARSRQHHYEVAKFPPGSRGADIVENTAPPARAPTGRRIKRDAEHTTQPPSLG